MLDFILLSGFSSDVFEEFNIAEIQFFVPPEIEQVNDNRNEDSKKSV